MNVMELCEVFGTGPAAGAYTVTRRAAGTYPGGVATPGTPSTITIEAAVQPLAGRDLKRLPEGRRAEEARTVFTVTELLVGGENQPHEADLISIDGGLYEVSSVQFYDSNQDSEPYYKAMVLAAYPQGSG